MIIRTQSFRLSFYSLAFIASLIPLIINIIFPEALFHSGGPDMAYWEASVFFDSAREFEKNGIIHGMYSPYLQCGTSYWWYPNFNPIYPLYFNWIGADSDIFQTLDRLRFVTALHLSLLSLAIILLTRSLGSSIWMALCAGIIAPWAAGVPRDPVMCASYPWLAFMVLASVGMVKNPKNIENYILICVSAASICYASPAQPFVFAFFSFCVFWIYQITRMALSPKSCEIRIFASVITPRLLLCGIFFLLLCGVYIWNITIFHGESIRWLGEGFGSIIGHQKIPMGAFEKYGMPITDLKCILIYSSENTRIIGNLFIGCALSTGILFSFFLTNKKITIPIALIGALSLALCFQFVVGFSSHIPLINKVREIGWWSLLALIPALTLGPLGIEKAILYSMKNRRAYMPYVFIILCMTFFGASFLTHGIQPSTVAAFLVLMSGAISCIFFINSQVKLIFAVTLLITAGLEFIPIRTYAPIEMGFEYSQSFRQIYADATAIKGKIKDYDLNYRVMVAPDYGPTKELSSILSTFGFRVIQTYGHPLNYPKFLATFSPSEYNIDSLGIRWVIHKNSTMEDNSPMISERLSANTYAYLITEKGDKINIPDSGILKKCFIVTCGSENCAMVINEDYRSGKKIEINGIRQVVSHSDTYQMLVHGINKGINVIQVTD